MLYDCFTFFNELDILEIRLHELARVVDRFVLVEATRTHSNKTKTLYFKDHRARFKPWLDRIIHVVADDLPGGEDAWKRENHQRNCIARGLTQCTDADTIMVSDLDEIPRAGALGRVDQLTFLQQRLSYYFLNYATGEPWHGTRMLPFSLLRQMGSVQAVRAAAAGHVIPQAGWHFSYTGGIEHIRQKIQSFAHQEFNTAEFLDPDHLRRAMAGGMDPYNRANQAFELVDLATLPAWVVENRQRLAPLLWSEFSENAYTDGQIQTLASACARTRGLIGEVLEIGSGEGKSTAALANVCYPEVVHAVDTWQNHGRDLHAVFLKHMRSLTLGNVRSHQMRSGDFLAQGNSPIKFCHMEAGRDYPTVKGDIEAALQRLVPRGMLCGNGFAASSEKGEEQPAGLERAVRELLPGFQTAEDFWYWQRPWTASSASQPIHAVNPLNLPKNEPYYDWPRDEVVQAIVAQGVKATRAIELGCSAGLFGSKLKAALDLQHYTGIEFDAAAAARARARLDLVHVADIQQTAPAALGIAPDEADLLIALDVLEHLLNPWDVLARWTQMLRAGAHVVLSLPNIQNISVILELVNGRWKYDSAGLLDVTHLRFFTMDGIAQLLAGAGLKMIRADSIVRPALDQSTLRDTGNSLQFGNLTLSSLSRQQVLQLFTYQYMVIATKEY